MSAVTSITWCDHTFNPWIGCTKVSPGCDHFGQYVGAGLDWVIVGGESGRGCRHFDPDWARSVRDQCRIGSTAFFMKQLGGARDKRDRHEDLPPDLRVREFPR